MRDGFVRPPTHHRLRATLNGGGRIEAWVHEQASGDALFGVFPKPVGKILGFDFGSTRGAQAPYAIEHLETLAWRRPMPIPTGAWRGLGMMANMYAVESFVASNGGVASHKGRHLKSRNGLFGGLGLGTSASSRHGSRDRYRSRCNAWPFAIHGR